MVLVVGGLGGGAAFYGIISGLSRGGEREREEEVLLGCQVMESRDGDGGSELLSSESNKRAWLFPGSHLCWWCEHHGNPNESSS